MMLAYVIGEFISLPGREISLEAFGFFVKFSINAHFFIAVLTSGLAVSGTFWLLHTHPAHEKESPSPRWALPALTAWVLSIALSSIEAGLLWWVTLIAGTTFLGLIWVAEYISVDPKDENFRAAASGLTALAFALYLALAINLRARGTRLIFILPAASLPVFIIIARYVFLKLESQDMLDFENRRTTLIAAGSVGILAGQLATAFHFIPLSPLSFGLALLSPVYAAGILFGNLVDSRPARRTALEPLLIFTLLWLLAIWVR